MSIRALRDIEAGEELTLDYLARPETRLPEAAIFGSEITVWITLLSPIAVLVLITWLSVGFLRRSR